jgi:MFS transporter, DHA1 family, tetracycline resistance protein
VSVRARFLVLVGLRWLPVGLMIPAMTLLALDRGLTLAQYGSAAALQGLVVLVLELPTGGLTDALGRRPVLLLAGAVQAASLALLTFADSVALFSAVFVLQGIYRALDSGPLEAWYVDRAPDDFETGLGHAGAVTGLAIGGGALVTGGLVAWGSLNLPVYAALALHLVSVAAVALLMHETRAARGLAALGASLRGVPSAILGAIGLLRRSRVIVALIAVELFWGFGMVTFETLTPVRLDEVLHDAQRASALMGPVSSAAWIASAAGAGLIPWLVRRIGAPWTGFTLRIVQGVTVAGMGILGGAAGIVTAFLLCYAAHGASSPVHNGLLHRQVEGPYRASLISLNSMVAQPAGALGLVALTAIASGAGTPAAMITGAVVLAVAAPLYLVARFARTTPAGMSPAPALTP